MEIERKFNQWNSGLFISLEGIEGSGKTTQINKIRDYYSHQGRVVTILREPGGTNFGESIRDVILKSKEAVTPIAEALLFASSRAQLIIQEIIPRLNNNEVVILDRYIHSSIAYQGFGRALKPETILSLHQYSPLNLIPNFTFYLKISIDTSIERQDKRGNEKDYFEKEDFNFYKKLLDGFDYCSKRFPQSFFQINAELSEQEVSKEILKVLEN